MGLSKKLKTIGIGLIGGLGLVGGMNLINFDVKSIFTTNNYYATDSTKSVSPGNAKQGQTSVVSPLEAQSEKKSPSPSLSPKQSKPAVVVTTQAVNKTEPKVNENTRIENEVPLDAESLFQSGRELYDVKHNTVSAVKRFSNAAELGHCGAMYYLGVIYSNDTGSVRTNFKKAFDYMYNAAQGGYDKAYFELAKMYHRGLGVEKDKMQAKFWYQKAADKGNDVALNLLKEINN